MMGDFFHKRRLRRVWWLISLLWVISLLLIATSRPFLRLVFPIYYRETVQTVAKEYRLDPWLIFAMIRVESRFNPQARSSKGAMGLMQLMPQTALWIAEQRGQTSFQVKDLYRPEVNVDFGCWYLRSLLNQFQGDEVLALAAYNGGDGRVRGWLEREQWSGERETLYQIPFPETRRYVQRVLAVREWYAWLYGSRERPPFLQ